jgi:hypothetical protein
MIGTTTKPKIKDKIKVERPRLHKVILVSSESGIPHERGSSAASDDDRS